VAIRYASPRFRRRRKVMQRRAILEPGASAMRIVFLGPPGAGKGTQAKRLCAALAVPHVSTGDMMRAAIQEGAGLGQRVKSFLDQGRLVPDELVNEVVEDRLARSDCTGGFLLDGYPRTLPQADALDAMLAAAGRPLDLVIELKADPEELVRRLVLRGRDSGRSDDTADVIRERLRVYEAETLPLSRRYRAAGLLVEVDGLGSIEEVEARIQVALRGKNGATNP
jgi:adenylate kinase